MFITVNGATQELTWFAAKPAKRGRQGYALFLMKSNESATPWHWSIEDHSGHPVAKSELYFRSKWDAKRSAFRLTDKIAHIYVDDQDGNRTREL